MAPETDTTRTPPASGLASLHVIADHLVERPDPALEEALNAATACFLRHGFTHTSVRDVAAELGVSKATVYRNAGSVDDLARALLAREAHRLVDTITLAVGDTRGPAAVLDLVTAAAGFICDHPVVKKVLADEPALVAELLGIIPVIATSITNVLTTVVQTLRPDPPDGSSAAVVADVAVRIVLAAVFFPPTSRDALVRDALSPHLGI